LRIQRHLFGCLDVEQAGNFGRWDRGLDLLPIALSDLSTMDDGCRVSTRSCAQTLPERRWCGDCAPLPDQGLEAVRGGFFASATAIAEINGRMKNASSAG
jgi:hypothetical protein